MILRTVVEALVVEVNLRPKIFAKRYQRRESMLKEIWTFGYRRNYKRKRKRKKTSHDTATLKKLLIYSRR